MKLLKTIVGILLIAAAVFAMYYWNSRGREKIQNKLAEETTYAESENKPNPREEMLKRGYSFFPISMEDIELKSNLLKTGDFIGIYYKIYPKILDDEDIEIEQEEYEFMKIGKFETAYIDNSSVELICSLDDFREIDMIRKKDNKLIFVLEASDE